MRTLIGLMLAWCTVTVANAAGPPTPQAAAAPAPPTYTFNLGARSACVIPAIECHARAEGGFIDVLTPSPNTMTVSLTGTAAANSHLGLTGSACETFQLVQEFEITCSDPAVRMVVLTLDSSIVGYVRSKHKAGACMKLANASVTPMSWDGTPLALSHPPLCVDGTDAKLCNQHLPPLVGPPMPLGRYTLTANFVITAEAGGICDGHAVADFSPDTALPADWVRMRDPFQGVAKKAFGYSLGLTAAPPEGAPLAARVEAKPATIQRVNYTPAAAPTPSTSSTRMPALSTMPRVPQVTR